MRQIGMTKILCFAAIFLIVLAPSLYIPMHSDDYSYYLMGMSFDKHYAHYMSWSGRIIADIISPLLLTTMPHWAYSAVNSIAFALLIMFISSISGDNESTKKPSSAIVTALVFMLYWVANPNLGQTSFWIVGSANYLWTNLFIAIFLSYLLKLSRGKKPNILSLAVMSILAGCSNENTSVMVSLITIFIVFYEKLPRDVKLTSIIGVVIGSAFLILSPGNMVRASVPVFDSWYSTSIIHRIFVHFFYRFPQAFGEYWPVYIVLVAALLVASFAGTLRKHSVVYVVVFFIASVGANAILVASPVFPPRSMSGGLFFLLIATSFALCDAVKAKGVFEKSLVAASVLFSVFYFVPSYTFFNLAMQKTYAQSKIRDSIVVKGKEAGKDNISIPEFYFSQLIKPYDRFDLSHTRFMANYFEVKSINTFKVNFDYSMIDSGIQKQVNAKIYNDNVIKKMSFYPETFGVRHFVIMELNGPLNIPKNSGLHGFMHVYLKDKSNYINADFDLDAINLNGRYFIGKDIKNADYDDIDRIYIGVYDTSSGKRVIENTIKF